METRPAVGKSTVAQLPVPTNCPLTAALNAIGGKWSLICLYWRDCGTRRFNELRRLTPEISHKVLAASAETEGRKGWSPVAKSHCNCARVTGYPEVSTGQFSGFAGNTSGTGDDRPCAQPIG